jgi:hypothetical protein
MRYARILPILLVGMLTVAATPNWISARDDSLGFRFSYPRSLFAPAPVEGDEQPSFHYFASRDAEAELMVGAWDDSSGQTPEEFKRWVMANAGGYDDLTYSPRGRSWFVLSGYRDDLIYYEKVLFSCGGRLVNIFAITYPQNQRALYDPVVERMEDTFQAGNRCVASE